MTEYRIEKITEELRLEVVSKMAKLEEATDINRTARGTKRMLKNIGRWALSFEPELARLETASKEFGIFPALKAVRSDYTALASSLLIEIEAFKADASKIANATSFSEKLTARKEAHKAYREARQTFETYADSDNADHQEVLRLHRAKQDAHKAYRQVANA